ncbi:helix-turn-helix domain-containing protein [Oceanobacillus oncorhynchi]|uniref:helix-turn-helix domain-containing protein n=1 Tax=Oceanobacillus oncorhynchi TaxID=545501 RepID=UPI00186867E7|nr:helix-turn-helix transcriptional regulator [Oceanobacillus oncorhynchi]
MTTFEIVKKLCEEQKISINDLEESLGYSKNTLYRLKSQKPGSDKLKAIADYFDVTTDYLLGRTDKKRYYDLTDKDERDVEKELERILNSAESDFGSAAFDGRELDDMDKEDYELYVSSLRNAIRMHKRLAKKKFTPKKYR